MNYETAKANIFATGTVPAGPVGDSRERVGFHLDQPSGTIILVHDHGWDSASNKYDIPPVIDVDEAIWILKNHPNAKRYIKITSHKFSLAAY